MFINLNRKITLIAKELLPVLGAYLVFLLPHGEETVLILCVLVVAKLS